MGCMVVDAGRAETDRAYTGLSQWDDSRGPKSRTGKTTGKTAPLRKPLTGVPLDTPHQAESLPRRQFITRDSGREFRSVIRDEAVDGGAASSGHRRPKAAPSSRVNGTYRHSSGQRCLTRTPDHVSALPAPPGTAHYICVVATCPPGCPCLPPQRSHHAGQGRSGPQGRVTRQVPR